VTRPDHSLDSLPEPEAPSPGKGLGRNMVLSGGAWLITSVVSLFAVRIVVNGLGASAYGIMALASAFAGYLSVLDLGLGQGVIRYMSMFVSLRQGRAMRQLLWRTFGYFTALGALGAVGMWVFSPWLAVSLLKVPPAMLALSVEAFRISGVAFALGMIAAVFSMVPEAFLRYDIAAWLSVTIGSATLAGPAVLVLLGYRLIPIMWFSVVATAVSCVVGAAITARLVGSVPNEGPELTQYWKEFLGFSFKNGVNRIWSAVQIPTSQLVIGVAGGVAAAGYFQVPMQISNKVSSLLSRLSTVLLPTGSQLFAEGKHEELISLYERSSRLFYVLNAAIVGAVVVFCYPLLSFWISPEFARAGAMAFALLTLAVGLNAVSMTASQLNMALGRPGVNLAFSFANSFINLGTVYFLTVAFGIAGTAASGLLAACVVPFFLFYSHRRVLEASSWGVFRDCYLRTTIAVVVVGLLSWFLLLPLASSLVVTIGLVGVSAALTALACVAIGVVTRADWDSLVWALRPRRRPIALDEGSGSRD
jgi:O-antigen/teichoic acid export membrane protein